jgi:hypothetical protein
MVSTRSRRPTPVQTEEYDPQRSAPANVVTPDHGTDAALSSNDGAGACNISLPRLLELRLDAVLESSNIAADLAFDQWLNQANFIALIETPGGPLTESHNNKVSVIDISKGLLKAMGRVANAGILNHGCDDESIITSEHNNVYYHQAKYQRKRINFYYVSSAANVTEAVELPAGEAIKEFASQEVRNFLKDDLSYLQNWWLSKKAEQLFKPYNDEDGAFQAVETLFNSLSKALRKGNDILMLVEGFIDSKKGRLNKEILKDYDPVELNTSTSVIMSL